MPINSTNIFNFGKKWFYSINGQARDKSFKSSDEARKALDNELAMYDHPVQTSPKKKRSVKNPEFSVGDIVRRKPTKSQVTGPQLTVIQIDPKTKKIWASGKPASTGLVTSQWYEPDELILVKAKHPDRLSTTLGKLVPNVKMTADPGLLIKESDVKLANLEVEVANLKRTINHTRQTLDLRIRGIVSELKALLNELNTLPKKLEK